MNLPKFLTYGALAAMPMALAHSATALDIDNFDGTQIVADAAIAPLVFSNQDDGSMLGGERDMAVVLGTGLLGSVGTVDTGVMSFSNSPVSQGILALRYDGNDDSNALDFDGLGGVDLTDGAASDALAFTLFFADFEVDYRIEVIDMNGEFGFFEGTLPTGISGGGDEVEIITPFASLSNALVDFSDVGAISLQFSAQEPAADIVIDNFRTGVVPEPSSLALLALGGLGLMRRRRSA